MSVERQIFRPLTELDNDGVRGAFIEEILRGAYDVKVAETNAVIAGATMWVSLTRARNRNLPRRCFQVDPGDDFAFPVRVIQAEIVRMQFHGSGW